MAKRSFELPGIENLSKEQEAARALPAEGQHLVIGGPGNGKVRPRAPSRRPSPSGSGTTTSSWVFNHLLDRASGQLFRGTLVSRTWIGWFLETFETLTGKAAPRLAPNNGFQEIDWARVDAMVQEVPAGDVPQRPHLVVDEGQDMPPEFYDALVGLGYDRFFVVADQNQQITEANSSRLDLQNCLAIDTDAVIELRKNYRNHFQIARLARAFYTGDPASPPPELPGPAAGAVPILYDYEESRLDEVARGILRLADRDPRQLIGVIAPRNTVRERYLEALRSTDVALDNPRPTIETFHGDNRPDVAFDEGGILVINARACKGLEFDTVVLADIDEHYVRRNDPDVAKRLFYVHGRASPGTGVHVQETGRREGDREDPSLRPGCAAAQGAVDGHGRPIHGGGPPPRRQRRRHRDSSSPTT